MNCIRPVARLLGLLWPALLCGTALLARADDFAQVDKLVKAGEITQATAKLDAFLVAKPKDPQLRFLKGVLLADSQHIDEAIAVFTLLSEDYPELPEPYNNLAVLYAGRGQYDKARVALEAAVRGNPGYATAYENLGDVYARLALQAYTRALALDARNVALPAKLTQLQPLLSAKAAAPSAAASTPLR